MITCHKIILVVSFMVNNVSGVSIMNEASDGRIPEVLDFFPEIDGDLSRVTWGHAINNQQLLKRSLDKSSPIMMLEADVSKGNLIGKSGDLKPIPIMAHPPSVTSDASLEVWLKGVIKANREGLKKGAKLDFKDLDIVLPSLEILRRHSASITFPLWLNADIIPGPGGENDIPVDADIFLSLCREFFPDATLSLGWVTRYKEGEAGKYTMDMIQDMTDTIRRNNIVQPITFPIRASFVGRSLDALQTLYKSHPESTFTIWTSILDDVDLEGIALFQSITGDDAVYIDMPEPEIKKIREIRARSVEAQSTSSSPLLYPGYFVAAAGSVTCLVVAFVAYL